MPHPFASFPRPAFNVPSANLMPMLPYPQQGQMIPFDRPYQPFPQQSWHQANMNLDYLPQSMTQERYLPMETVEMTVRKEDNVNKEGR